MKKISLLLCMLMTILLLQLVGVAQNNRTSNSTQRNSNRSQNTTFIEGELLVKFEGGAAIRSNPEYQQTVRQFAEAVHKEVGAQLIKRYTSNWELVRLPKELSVPAAAAAYDRARQRVLTSFNARLGINSAAANMLSGLKVLTERNGIIMIPPDPIKVGEQESGPQLLQAGVTPNDPVFPQLQRYRVLQAQDAWAITTGSHDVIVAVLDSGVDYNHEDLRANMWSSSSGARGYNTCTGANDPAPFGSHGTHVAGIIGEVGNNGIKGVGVNWKVKILSVNIFCGRSASLAENESTVSQALDGYEYIINAKSQGVNIRVANNSWRNVPADAFFQSQMDQIAEAGRVGILSPFAAGNDRRNNDVNPTYPATYQVSSIVSVAATNINDTKADFSSFGATKVHIGAPGVEVYSTFPGNQYGTASGTSMATPVVSGAAALLLAASPNLTPEQVKQRILDTGDAVAPLNGLVLNSKRLNLFKMVQGMGGGGGTPGPNPTASKIVFTSRRDGNKQIYIMEADGSRQTRLSNNTFNDYSPHISPDGRHIVFVSDRDGHPEIYVMDIDGRNPRRLTSGSVANEDPSWAPIVNP